MKERRRIDVSGTDFFPAYVVWELTLRCDHQCHHCGSRAGRARDDELSVDKAIAVAKEMGAMGTREVVLIGGEAYLFHGYLDVARALRAEGINVVMTTGGRGITPERAREMADAGFHLVSVSVDGDEATHDAMRNSKGSFAAAMDALKNLKAARIKTASNININRSNAHTLEDLYDTLRGVGIVAWQVQITAALGRAADRPHMLLQPSDLLDLMPRITALKTRGHTDGVHLMPGNNLGYFGPDEALLRSNRKGGDDHWAGCQAGKFVMGIESDGGVKGCPSLQSDAYITGSLQEHPLSTLWDGSGPDGDRIAFTRNRSREDLWGYCGECVFADTCLGGCSFTAHALFGRPGNNPYCHFRAQQFAKRGLKETVRQIEAPPGTPFDNGRFELVVEPLETEVAPAARRTPLVVLN